MCGVIGGAVTIGVGVALVLASTIVSFGVLPGIIDGVIEESVVLVDDSLQMERFEEFPFPLNFGVYIFNVTNRDAVLAGGVPDLQEVGPFVYKLYSGRELDADATGDDKITYTRLMRFEFDSEASYPHSENDYVRIVNIPYHAILQVAEATFPNTMGILGSNLASVFEEYNAPIVDVRVRDLLLDGIPLCRNPTIIGRVVCATIRSLADTAKTIDVMEDNSLKFSLLSYRHNRPSAPYEVLRGVDNSADLGRITLYDGSPHVSFWSNPDGETSRCNMVNGTDTTIYPPFVDRNQPIFAYSEDICRSVELRYQEDTVFEGIPAVKFSSNEWFLSDKEGCFCLGITNNGDCLRQGALELFTCVGGFLVASYPHFLYADPEYINGVFGMRPVEEDHRIFMELEPNSGTILRGAKRVQFNLFMRPISSIAATENLRNVLTPALWVDESTSLPEELVDEVKTNLLGPLGTIDIVVPVAIAVSCVVLLVGVGVTLRAKLSKSS